MGGDQAPNEIVAGAVRAAREGIARILLTGDETRLRALAGDVAGVEIVHAAGEVAMDAHASHAVRNSAGTSLGVAVDLVRDGRADAVVSAGNSGAFLGIALIRLRTIAGVARPAICVVLPGRKGPAILCDAGANVDCKPEWMAQFGVMASAYARAAFGIEQPRVAVVSVGEERSKGNAQSIEAAALLETMPVNFIGNIEGKDIFSNVADVIVADGFVGNVILKTAEGAAVFIRDSLRVSFEAAGPLQKLGYLLSRSVFENMRKRTDYATYGGAPLLGVRGHCLVAHGRSDSTAIYNAVKAAVSISEANVVGMIETALAPAAVV